MDTAAVDRLDARINALGASLFFHELTVSGAAEAGVDNLFVMYAGRAGVLGDVSSGQVASALAFFNPSVVTDVWEGVRSHGSPQHMADVFAASMSAAAQRLWDPATAAKVVEIGTVVIESVTPIGLALFTGWREVARARGDASSVVHALRELRGDIHVQCISVQGLYPLEAEMVTRGDSAAQLHGWKPPYPDPAPFVDRVAAAEAATGERMAAVYSASLSAEQFQDLDDAVARLLHGS